MARRVKIVAVHKSDAFGTPMWRQRLIGKTGVWLRRNVWKKGSIRGVKHYEYGEFLLDIPVRGIRDPKLSFYGVSTMPVRR